MVRVKNLEGRGWQTYLSAFGNGDIKVGARVITENGRYSARPDSGYLCDSSVGKPNNVHIRKAIGSGQWEAEIITNERG
ncbi:MAG: hypothetical protein JW716_03695 [Candidatus Aenigmarchaeota archaeon]|nr:hypothetical protein [Candidatus Aenigmarchaeota archaeon]